MYIKVYFILAHKNPSQIQDLIALLDDNKSLFFIHLDKKVNQKEYENSTKNSSCHFVKNRVLCDWGTYSLVQATLNTMKEVQRFMIEHYTHSDYHFIMLSSEDLPLKRNEAIHEFLESNIDTSFLDYWKLPYNKWWGGGLFRLENFYFFQYKKFPKLNYWTNRVIKKMHFSFLLPLNRFKNRFPNFQIYGSSQWMILTKDLLGFILEKSNKNIKFNSIFKYVLAPDELYFATVILNYNLQDQFVVCDKKTHLVCFNGAEASPRYLKVGDLYCVEEGLLFARKFDPENNAKTINAVKKMISQ
ncbi:MULTISPECIES: beta-1,6-N-acetylglucosaminyltransferase [unclassified Flavobacterium]|uniref:beta-1,6-N-acetylglucosaminyltransferase n=1 Tax=unclassified Flavobacterium TaxID=196869 RepID=UPI000F83F3AD|nr:MULTISPECIES: beta-1,6-N-acetylglucosaminyltransferase [unclassified Flavobacterium]RTY71266.1 hypothetical protein EKL95_00720 [Flavobacterium sp. LB2P53]RTY76868.1 hypothetical protein EKL96_05125 [Flavobacterium sp. LS1R10]RTY95468.1 hypothetical protein EKL32_05525 [Flavobacterium sp. GSN2]